MNFRSLAVLFTFWIASSNAQSHLPLAEGQTWELASGDTKMVLRVEEVQNNAYGVRWENPWIAAKFFFVPDGDRVILSALDMGNGVARFSDKPVYFDFTAAKGRQWSNSIGSYQITERGHTVKTPSGTYSNCIEIRLRDQKGSDTFWTFAPAVGFIQFGKGNRPFQLQRFTAPPASSVLQTDTPANSGRGTGSVNRRGFPRRNNGRGGSDRTTDGNGNATTAQNNCCFIGLDSNPPPSEGYSPDSNRRRYKMSVDAGATLAFLHPKWDEVEPRQGRYNWKDLDFRASLARDHNMTVMLNLRTVDGNNRSIPSLYAGWKFDDPRFARELRGLLEKLALRVGNNVRYIAIGNEVDHYFDNRKNEIRQYASLMQAVLPDVRRLFPGALFTINFSNQATARLNSDYQPLVQLCDFISYNYYPINADFTFRHPDNVRSEMETMIRAAGDLPVVFQELGYATSARIQGSEELQARFVEEVFDVAQRNGRQVEVLNFNWMSDLPQSVVDDLGRYYKMPNGDQFKEYLGTLGWFDRDGRPKQVWSRFGDLASRVKRQN